MIDKCPICQTKPKATQHYCKKCAWEFEYYFDELSDEAREIYEDRFRIYQRIYEKSLLEPKMGYQNKEIITIDGLMYQNQPFTKRYTWKEANEYAKKLRLGEYDDWRLPTKEELQKLMTSTKNSGKNGEYFIRQEFVDNLEGYGWFWSSKEKDSSFVWNVYFKNGYEGWYDKTHKYYTLCVRDNINKGEKNG